MIEKKMLTYFAYGSNMSTHRLRERVQDCEPIGSATLYKHDLRFHKRSKDGSGKCDAYFTGLSADNVIGVLFKFPETQQPNLDRAEGAGNGYNIRHVEVVASNGEVVTALTYLAADSHIDPSLVPTKDYLEHVLTGAHEHKLPESYQAAIIKKSNI